MSEPRPPKMDETSPSRSLRMSRGRFHVLDGEYSTVEGVMSGSRGATGLAFGRGFGAGVAATNALRQAGSSRVRRAREGMVVVRSRADAAGLDAEEDACAR